MWHVLHSILLICTCFLHLFGIDVLGHLGHQESDSNHQHEWVLDVSKWIEGWDWVEVLDARRWVKHEWIHQAEVFPILKTEEVSFGVLAWSELLLEHVNDDWLKVEDRVEDFELVAAWGGNLDFEAAEVVDEASVLTAINRDCCLLELE